MIFIKKFIALALIKKTPSGDFGISWWLRAVSNRAYDGSPGD